MNAPMSRRSERAASDPVLGSGPHRYDRMTGEARRVMETPGRALTDGERRPAESRFAHDFSRVRVHEGRDATFAAGSVGARGFAYGNHVVLGRPAAGDRDVLTHELAHVAAESGSAPSVQRAPCKNQAAVDALIAANPRNYGTGVTMVAREIVSGDTLDGLAEDTVGDNDVPVLAHYKTEIKALNKTLKTGTVGNCALVLKGWKDPVIGTLPAAPKANALTDEAKHAIATIYAEQTGSGTQAMLQQEFIWYSIRHRLRLGLQGPTIDDVLDKGGYWGKGSARYTTALKELDGAGAAMPALVNAQTAVIGKWSAALPATSAPFYFHWRAGEAADRCFKTATAKPKPKKKKPKTPPPPIDLVAAEKKCAWNYAKGAGITGVVPASEGWHNKIVGDSGDDRLGAMYLYRFS
jgi:hypothetical protein